MSVCTHPFIFDTCGQDKRILITVDDSALAVAHSIVYFDSTSNQVVFIGGQSPNVGVYLIKISAVIKIKTKYLISSLDFELEVLAPGS